MIKNIFLAVLVVCLCSCKGKVDKLLMSNDVVLKEKKAQEYFEKCDYASASPLFKDLIQSFSTSAKVEKVYFYFAFCDYMLEDYMLAAYEFKKILEKFPRGKYAERAQFLIGDAYFNSTPKYNLDQQYNLQAVEEFQIFLEKYPNSSKREEVNKKIDLLIEKRERKAFENAKLFYDMSDYKSALQSFQFVLNDFPDTRRDEELNFLLVESAYLYAEKSIEYKKEERYKAVNEYALRYLKKYESKKEALHVNQVKSYQEKSKLKAEELQHTLPVYYYKKRKHNKAIALWAKLLEKSKGEEKEELAELILKAHSHQALTAEKDDKIEAVSGFLKAYDDYAGKLNQSKTAKWKSKQQYFEKLSRELPGSLPFDFLADGEYQLSSKYFDELLDTANLDHSANDKIFYYALLSKHKYAQKLQEVPAKVQWDDIILKSTEHKGWEQGKFDGRISTLLKDVNKALAKYPAVLVKNPMRRKNYSLAVKRAKKQIGEGITGKDREEVVYLLLLSSVKRAKSVKKYERLPQYENAKTTYEKYAGEIKDAELTVKAGKIKEKIDKGIIKYQNK